MGRKDSQRGRAPTSRARAWRAGGSIAIAALLLCALAWPGWAQVTETPIAFDSAGKIRTLTPALVTRFGLKSPEWPASASFLEARLFAISAGGRVLAVEHESGAVDRFAFSDEQVMALRSAIGAGMARTGAIVTEERTDVISQPARGAFIRNQMLLTWIVYGPLLSSLTNDAKTGTVVYLAATGASYFITTGIGKKTAVTRAQNHLSTDGAFRGAGLAAGLLYAAQGDQPDQKVYSSVALAGALGGTIAGFKAGRGRTDSEAEAATTISTLSALTGLGISGAVGGINEVNDGRGAVGGIVAAGIAGYALGPKYPRNSRYAVTRGDVQMLTTGALLGAAAGIAPFVNGDPEEKILFGSGTAGMLTGIFMAERLMAKQFDYTTADATLVGLGLAAGGLMGGAVLVLTEIKDPAVGMSIVTAGAIIGTVAGHKLANPQRAGFLRSGIQLPQSQMRGAHVEFDPWAATLAASRVPGRHALVSLRF